MTKTFLIFIAIAGLASVPPLEAGDPSKPAQNQKKPDPHKHKPPTAADDPPWQGPGGSATAPTSGNWNTGSNWGGGSVPGDIAALSFGGSGSSSYTSTNNITGYLLGAVSLTSTSSATDIIGGNQFQIGGTNATSISQGNTGAFTIQNPFDNSTTNNGTNLTLTGNGTGLVTLSGIISEKNTSKAVSILKTGTGTFVLSGANTFSGATTINAGILNYQNNSAFGNDGGTLSAITVASGATAQLQGGITSSANLLTISGTGASGATGALENVSGTNNYAGLVTLAAASTISSDAGTLNLTNTGTITGATFGLTLTGAGNGSISSIIGTTTGGLTKSGAGTWTLSGANTYSGATTINAGTLKVDNAGSATARLANTSNITVNTGGTLLLASSSGSSTNRINDAATITLNGGTFNTGGLSEGTTGSAGVGALTLQDNSIIDLGAGASILHFAASGAATWTASKILEIDNWSGTATGGGTDQLLFGTTSSGLTASQIAEIQFLNPAGFSPGTYGAIILANGEIVPTAVPEPSTWAAAALVLGALVFSQRRRRQIRK